MNWEIRNNLKRIAQLSSGKGQQYELIEVGEDPSEEGQPPFFYDLH